MQDVELFELATRNGARPSPFCWRTRLALAHRGITPRVTTVRFGEIRTIGDGTFRTVPVLRHGGTWIGGSGAIAEHVETHAPGEASLFPDAAPRALAAFVDDWVVAFLHVLVFRLIVADIHARIAPEDQAYFRETRERRLGMSLEAAQADREARRPAFRAALEPLRVALRRAPWLGGAHPAYVDYLVFGALQWPRIVSRFELLAPEDPVAEWFGRVLDLHDGLGRAALIAE
jgi:glutathione S-transferase